MAGGTPSHYKGGSAEGFKWWREEGRLEKLRELWDEGISTAEIGRRLGCTKNAVIGQARRLNCTPRIVAQPKPEPKALAAKLGGCAWPIGHPDKDNFKFCNAAPERGRPYCEKHCKIAYVKQPTKRELAEAEALANRE